MDSRVYIRKHKSAHGGKHIDSTVVMYFLSKAELDGRSDPMQDVSEAHLPHEHFAHPSPAQTFRPSER